MEEILELNDYLKKQTMDKKPIKQIILSKGAYDFLFYEVLNYSEISSDCIYYTASTDYFLLEGIEVKCSSD